MSRVRSAVATVALSAAMLPACGSPRPPSPSSAPTASSPPPSPPAITRASARWRVELSTPERASIEPSARGHVSIHGELVASHDGVAAEAPQPLELRVLLERDGRRVACHLDASAPRERPLPEVHRGDRDARPLEIDCPIVRPGGYTLSFEGRFGDHRLAWSRTLEVDGPDDAREHPTVPGLAMVASSSESVGPPELRSHPVVVVVVNTSTSPLELGAIRAQVRMFRGGRPARCNPTARLLALPTTLAPGAVASATIALECAHRDVGRYELRVAALVGDTPPFELAPLHLTVAVDPARILPHPAP